mmetsp:Transcript_33781/g.60349  ORF Transcript_33781/g.60349 Transcript_33781/m.60349 type:complete len:310 (+) Transcript_33781:63-992(+)
MQCGCMILPHRFGSAGREASNTGGLWFHSFWFHLLKGGSVDEGGSLLQHEHEVGVFEAGAAVEAAKGHRGAVVVEKVSGVEHAAEGDLVLELVVVQAPAAADVLRQRSPARAVPLVVEGLQLVGVRQRVPKVVGDDVLVRRNHLVVRREDGGGFRDVGDHDLNALQLAQLKDEGRRWLRRLCSLLRWLLGSRCGLLHRVNLRGVAAEGRHDLTAPLHVLRRHLRLQVDPPDAVLSVVVLALVLGLPVHQDGRVGGHRDQIVLAVPGCEHTPQRERLHTRLRLFDRNGVFECRPLLRRQDHPATAERLKR